MTSMQVSRQWRHLNVRRREHLYKGRTIEQLLWDPFCDSKLIKKCISGSLIEVKVDICEGEGVNVPSSSGETALLVASQRGRLEIVQYLLRHGANPMLRDGNKQTALHRATITNSHHDIIIDLLEAGADIDADDFDFGTPLHLACLREEMSKVSALLSLGAKPNATNIGGATALHFACSIGALDIVRCLLKHGANIAVRTDAWLAPLHVAAYNGRLDVARLLVDHGALVAGGDLGTRDGVTALHVACCRRERSLVGYSTEMLEYLLDVAGDDAANIPDASGASSLLYACRHLTTPAVSCLLSRGARVNAADWRGRGALCYLMRNGYRCLHDEFVFELWHEQCNAELIRTLALLLERGVALPTSRDDDDVDSCLLADSGLIDEDDEVDEDELNEDDVIEELSRDDIDEMAAVQKHACVVKCLLKAGATIESLCIDSETLFFEDFVGLSDVDELPLLSGWCRWRLAAGFPVDITVADALIRRVTLVSALEDITGDDDADARPDSAPAARRRQCYAKVREDAEWMIAQVRTPRTLMHLSRAAIRTQLVLVSNNCSIFPRINALPLPKIIADLIKLSDMEPFLDFDAS